MGELKSAAMLFSQASDPIKAAELFRQANDLKSAATQFEQVGHYRKAAELYDELEDFDGQLRCLLEIGAHFEATRVYERRGHIELAIVSYRKHLLATPNHRTYWNRKARITRSDCKDTHIAVRLAACGHRDCAARIFANAGHHSASAALTTTDDTTPQRNRESRTS